MIESDDFIDPVTHLPVFSLYGASREPTEQMLGHIDAFLVDLQDIGTRIYTFMYTLANCMRAARKHGKRVIVLDRPNPINGLQLEGNVLDPLFSSFVGQFPICVRHGLTMAELARLFNDHFGIDCHLEIIKLKGWRRGMHAEQWKRDWIPPSPNIPSPASARVFPGSVLFEGTNISEGRGTTRPFEWIGAPYIRPDKLAKEMNDQKLPGIHFRPIYFQPTYQKWKDQVCGGVHLHVTDFKKFNAYRAGVRLLAVIAREHADFFQWKTPPYEYEPERMPIDLIAGSSKLRERIDRGEDIKPFEDEAEHDLAHFRKVRKTCLLYND
jgi:uncharacterized protein YbbC (DUF1343 family)